MSMMMDAFGLGAPSATHDAGRRRYDWVRADVRCLMCGRLIGRLLGTIRRRPDGDRSAAQPVSFLAFRPLDTPGPIMRYSPELRFRCTVCGGAGALDDVDPFSTYEELPAGDLPDPPAAPRRAGRPPRGLRRPGRPSAVTTALDQF